MSEYSKETMVRCWKVKLKISIEGMAPIEDDYLLLINGEKLMEQMEPWMDTYFDEDSMDGIEDKFEMHSECVMMTKDSLMNEEQTDPCYTEEDIDAAIEYQQEMFG